MVGWGWGYCRDFRGFCINLFLVIVARCIVLITSLRFYFFSPLVITHFILWIFFYFSEPWVRVKVWRLGQGWRWLARELWAPWPTWALLSSPVVSLWGFMEVLGSRQYQIICIATCSSFSFRQMGWSSPGWCSGQEQWSCSREEVLLLQRQSWHLHPSISG